LQVGRAAHRPQQDLVTDRTAGDHAGSVIEDVLEGAGDHRLPRTRRDDPTIVDERPVDVHEYRLTPTPTLYTADAMLQLYAIVPYQTFWN
jgi:hypothetical protein